MGKELTMKKLALPALLLLSAVALGQAPETASLNGKWKVHTSMAGNDSDQDCTFTQTNSDLSGECTSDQGTVKIKGKIDNKNVTWSYDSDYNGTPLTVKYNGKLDTDKITGDAAVDAFGVNGDFTATRSK